MTIIGPRPEAVVRRGAALGRDHGIQAYRAGKGALSA